MFNWLKKLLGGDPSDPPSDDKAQQEIARLVKEAMDEYKNALKSMPSEEIDDAIKNSEGRPDRYSVSCLALEEDYRRSNVLHALREITGMSLKEVQVVVDLLPFPVATGIDEEMAEEMMFVLAQGGIVAVSVNETAMCRSAIAARKEED